MSNAPASLLTARALILKTLPAMNPVSVGIVGDDSHKQSGSSYHLGKDALVATSYSIVESSRDRNGLTDAAAALDFGWFSVVVKGKTHNLRTFSAWLVVQCKGDAADTKDIREVIYSLDGKTVKRWDRLGKRTTGDSSHTSHTHISYFRDSEKRDKTALFRRYFIEIGLLEDDMATATAEEIATAVWAKPITSDWLKVEKRTAADWLKYADACRRDVASTRADLQTIGKALLAAISANHGAGDVDEDAIIAGVLAGISPEKIVALIPQSIAQEVVDQLAARIAA
jgi:hypothetical protein